MKQVRLLPSATVRAACAVAVAALAGCAQIPHDPIIQQPMTAQPPMPMSMQAPGSIYNPGYAGRPLFEETIVPVCAPSLLKDRSRPLKQPADLAHHTLLAVEGYPDESLMVDWVPWRLAASSSPNAASCSLVRGSMT